MTRFTGRQTRVVAAAIAGFLVLGLAACSPQSSDTGSSGAASGGDGSVKLALVAGGAHPYFQPWKTAGDQLTTDFGVGTVTFDEKSEWDQTKQNDEVNSLVANGYNAIGIFGVSPTDINSTFKRLAGSGIAVASLAGCPTTDNQALFCMTTNTEEAAYQATVQAIKAIGGKGNIVHMTGNNVDSNTQLRIAGVKRAVDETNGAVTLVQTITDVESDLAIAQKAASDLLAAQGSQINAIVTTATNASIASAEAVKESGLPITVIAIDDEKTVLDGIRDGSVALTIAQNSYGQAYVGGWALAQIASGACTMAKPGAVVDSGSFVVTKANIDTYDQERKDFNQKLMTTFKDTLLTCK